MHTLILALTNSCPLRCKFCCVPPKAGNMDYDLAKRLIHEASILKFKEVGFTGGEPLIVKRNLLKLGHICNQYNLKWGVTTGMGWAKSELHSHSVALELIESGLSSIGISIDPSHLEQVDVSVYYSFIKELTNSNVNVTLSITLYKSERSNFEKYLNNNFKEFLHHINVDYHYVAPVGLAANDNNGDSGSIQKLPPYHPSMKCPLSKGFTFSVWPDGKVYPCCSTYVVNKNDSLVVGNVLKKSLSEIVKLSELDPYLTLMRQLGFSAIINLLKNHDLSDICEKEFSDICELCNFLGTNKNGTSINNIRYRLYNNIAIKKVS